MRGRGLKPSTPERIAHRRSIAGHPRLVAALSGGCLLDAPQVMDQGQTSTCWAHSLSAGLWTSCNALRKPIQFVPSPLDIASLGYALIRSRATPTGALPPLSDDGAELQDGADTVAEWGVSAMLAPVDGRYSDIPETSPFPEPKPLQAELSAQQLLVGPYTIPIDSGAPSTVAQCLDSGIAVWVGGLVGQTTEALQPGQIEQPTPENDPTAGGHARFIRGYRTATGGALEFLVRNSWGPAWCGTGECWASEEWLLAQWNLFPLAVK